MTQAAVSRRRPCRQCGGRYFVSTISIGPAILAILVALGGIAKAVTGSGFLEAVNNGVVPSPESFVQNAGWALGGIVLAGVVAFIGHGHRCIGCDTRR
jgi:hypothetical protein